MEKEQTMESPVAMTREYGEANDYDDGQHRDDVIGPQQQQKHSGSSPNASPQSYHQATGTAVEKRSIFDDGAVSVASGRSYLTADDRSRKSRSRSRGYDVADIRHQQRGRGRGDEDNRSTNSRGYTSQSFDRFRERSQSRGRGFSLGRERSQSRGRGGVGGGSQQGGGGGGGGGGDDSSIRSGVSGFSLGRERSQSRGRGGVGGGSQQGGGGDDSSVRSNSRARFINNNNNKRRRSRSRSQGGGGFDPRSPRGPSRSRGRSQSMGRSGRGPSRSRGRSQSMGRSGRRRRSRSQQQQKPEWPPCFEDDGTSYVFDPRSAMFYEAESEFFYDPKSKLYYGNKRAAYFRYDDSVDPPFVVVQSTASTATVATTVATSGQTDEKIGASGTGVDDAAAQGSVSNTTTDPALTLPLHIAATSANTIDPVVVVSTKPSIAIKLKKKKIGNKKKPSTEASPAALKVKKELVHIEKWTEKQAELKQGLASGTEKQPPSSSAMPSPAPRPQHQQQKAEEAVCAPDPLPPVKFTSKGEPMCAICKRKFPTVEKLRVHEKDSPLHKTNLEKLKLKKQQEEAAAAAAASNNQRKEPPDEEQPSSTTTQQQYEDRAQKRRDLHGLPAAGGISSRVAGSVVITENSRRHPNLAADTLGQDNVGHQLLRKLGWDRGGSSETKKSVVVSSSAAHAAAAVLSNRVAAAGRAAGSSTASTTAADSIRKEWDVIEAKAAANARGGNGKSSRRGF